MGIIHHKLIGIDIPAIFPKDLNNGSNCFRYLTKWYKARIAMPKRPKATFAGLIAANENAITDNREK